MDMEEVLKKLDNKFKLLEIKDKSTSKILNQNKERELNRLLQFYENQIHELHKLRDNAEEGKIAAGEEIDKIEAWGAEFDEKVQHYEQLIDALTEAISAIRRQAENEKIENKKSEQALHLQNLYEEEKRIAEMKSSLREQYPSNLGEQSTWKERNPANSDYSVRVKLPKLTITKFSGSYVDWMRFWNQFTTEIDSANIAGVTKFSYLKEFVNTNVRLLIDGLPFSTEGYERAKSILQSKYGKPSEIITAHVKGIMELPTITGANPVKIHDFFEKLVTHVQSMETLGKLKTINGYVRLLLDRLPGIRYDLVRDDDDWDNWEFPHLVEALRKWTERNPIQYERREKQMGERKSEKSFQMQQKPIWTKLCVYCEQDGHKSGDCQNVKELSERKQVLSSKRLCFNCTRVGHRASQCKSRSLCFKCKSKHHTSICDKSNREFKDSKSNSGKNEEKDSQIFSTVENSVTYPVVVVMVNGVKCRALVDTGAGSCYASSTLINRIGVKPVRLESRRIEMLLHTTSRKIEVCELDVASTDGNFHLPVEVSKVEKDVLLKLSNPNYNNMVKRFSHLRGIKVEDNETKLELPVHMILGASEYSKIKMKVAPRVGTPGDPVAELTRFGWMFMSPGYGMEENLYLTQSSMDDYDQLCRLDVLGLEDKPQGDQEAVYKEFKEQLQRNPDGWYETGLMWKAGHPDLQNNKAASLGRLSNLLNKLKRNPDLFQEYDEKIKEQLAEGIIEQAPDPPMMKEFYIPHKPIVRESAESTRLRIVYDASARPNADSPSLNECLETGPNLQNLIWSVLTRNRMRPIALTGDLKQAFLQIRIRKEDRDALRFHWIKDRQTMDIEVLRFTRALFGLGQSPFILGGTVEHHLDEYQHQYPDIVEEIKRDIYVDDIIGGGESVADVKEFKEKTIHIFGKAKFELHKWHSNVPELESANNEEILLEQTYAKQKMNIQKDETTILGLNWNKHDDLLGVKFPDKETESTKRGVLQYLASIYDPLGLVSPVLLLGKMMFREICDMKLGWDKPLPSNVMKRWVKWKGSLPPRVDVPRALPCHKSTIHHIDLHSFGDASIGGTSTATYAVIFQATGISQGLIGSNSRLSKKGLTIPRLELVASHMVANTLQNTSEALSGFPINYVVGWSDSSVALHWIRGRGKYKQFVKNRIDKIQSKQGIVWRYVNTTENPADIGSRGCIADKLGELWWKGPKWLPDYEKWPEDIETSPSGESEAESKQIREILATAVTETDEVTKVLEKYSFWKMLRVTAFLRRFVDNCRRQKVNRLKGPLTTVEIENATRFWVSRTQGNYVNTTQFKNDAERLNLQKNGQGIYICRGRIKGDYPEYLPHGCLLSEKIIEDAHLRTMHGGVGYTLTEVRQRYWIPRLRQLSKRIIHKCPGCKRFRAVACPAPKIGNLPQDRTERNRAFQVIGIDYAGPLLYHLKGKKVGKAYILLYSCSLSRAVYLDLLPNQTQEEFLMSLKQFIARRGRPTKIYSDNFSTFVAASKWLKKIMMEEKIHNFLAKQHINWQFNLSKAPWWGGQFERIIGLVKQSLYKVMGKSSLSWKELESLLLDVEITLNNRPLGYVEDDLDMPILTPNIMLFGQANFALEGSLDLVEDHDLKKRAKYLKICKEKIWRRWTNEYLKSLRERHNLTHKSKVMNLKVGDVVIIRGDEKNRAHWKIGLVENLIKGHDGVVRAVRLRAGKSFLERAVQHLYPLELSCDKQTQGQAGMEMLNAGATEFRPRRTAAAIAVVQIQDQINRENEEPVSE